MTKPNSAVDGLSGLSTGMILAGLFNPWDRALYLSVIKQRRFFSSLNWSAPYHGFTQTVVQRTLSGGLYFVLQSEMRSRLQPLLEDELGMSTRWTNFSVGLTAGLANGMLLNQLATIKYHSWGKSSRTFWTSASHMWRKGSARPFFKGIYVTGLRDTMFGCAYEVLRGFGRSMVDVDSVAPVRVHDGDHRDDDDDDAGGLRQRVTRANKLFVIDMLSAGAATVVSGPLNYVRNLKYAAPASLTPPTIRECLTSLWHDAQAKPTPLESMRYLGACLRIGWGTARVAMSMAVGQQLFEFARTFWLQRLQ
jgi:hypothetical protein